MAVNTAKELAEKRLARIMAAINLEEPDRVPLRGFGGDVIPAYYGITQHEYCYDYEKAIKAVEKYLKDFPFDWPTAGITGLDGRVFSVAFSEYPDIASNTTFITGPMHDVLGDKYYRYPGREIAEDASPQFIGGTFMEADEYDKLIEDPVKFVAETVLPRTCRNMGTPRQTMATMVKLGMEFSRFAAAAREIGAISAQLGYPSIPLGGAYAPLDIIGDFLRGIENVLLDIRRYPEKVKKAAEALVEPIVNYALAFKKRGINIAFIPLHLNEYLSPKLYKEFYWPTLKAVILRLVEEGMKVFVFFEGRHDAHLETILELPKGWGIAYFEKTDVVKVKNLLQGHTCVMGGIPISLLVGGTPASIEKYVKNLLEQVKPGGGFILSTNIGTAPKETPLENITALIEAVEKYG
ncbi:uroporphyrinogen decarboxylase family protein [Thermosediminibacter litoriperuensis]|uniref:Uroporphyrinogen decarboxylase n=1 Tax=Thermosediminibacter litoriperuensis TaxID=291989 RepID=A0A5S5AVS0_9FIRM|nr:uroporphyrinogen decarboxylase family protein [Thermosediminibacter litoriperuensis]TYP56637.1 uroporphyrinogen decarboxylase [Thermosediminibacter litoriperuensis]